jgi:hypothetical protein
MADPTVNPYDVEDTCTCSAWSANECACDGFVDGAQVRAWDEGYRAGTAKVEALRAELARIDHENCGCVSVVLP